MTRFAQVDMNAVAPLLPGDKVAGRVAGRGEHFDFNAAAHHIHSDLPIAWRPPLAAELSMPTFVDLTGASIGRLKVIGIAAEVEVSAGTRWVVRCVCGSYEVRRAKYAKSCLKTPKPAEEEPMCLWCNKTRKLQRGFGIVRSEPLIKVEGYK